MYSWHISSFFTWFYNCFLNTSGSISCNISYHIEISSLLINNGANVTLVAKYLGHTKIEKTLNTYSHMFSTALDSVVSVIDSLE